MRVFLLVFHLLVTLILIGIILIQRGEDAGAGGGGSGLPGARSGKNPLTRVTAVLAAIFFADCLGMAILIRQESKIGGDAVVKNPVPQTSATESSTSRSPSVPDLKQESKGQTVVPPLVPTVQKNSENKESPKEKTPTPSKEDKTPTPSKEKKPPVRGKHSKKKGRADVRKDRQKE